MYTHKQRYQASWGMKMNHMRSSVLDLYCPSWANPAQSKRWSKLGIVVWDEEQRQITHLQAGQALKSLNRLRADRELLQVGITVGEPAVQISISTPPSRQKRKGQQPPVAKSPIRSQQGLIHTIQLSSVQTQYLFDVLQQHEGDLLQMAEADNKRAHEVWLNVYKLLFRGKPTREVQEANFATRPLPWTFIEKSMTCVCTVGSNRATLVTICANLLWQGCFEQPDQFKTSSPIFMKLEDALAWAENKVQVATEVVPIPAEPQIERPRLSLETLTPEYRERLTPYWIKPSTLEPSRITYRAVILLVHAASERESFELSFGEKIHFDTKYPTILQLAQKLNIDGNTVDVQSYGDSCLYSITSLMAYADKLKAEAQAQLLWDRSRITAAYREGQVVRAIYGIKEEETGYLHPTGWLGENSWLAEERATSLGNQALRLTLAYALDTDGFRAMTGLDVNVVSDGELVKLMHNIRAKSRGIPRPARQESVDWLKQHGLLR